MDSSRYRGGSWSRAAGRGFGDHGIDVHFTTVDGGMVTETKANEGAMAASLDGTSEGTVNANASAGLSRSSLCEAARALTIIDSATDPISAGPPRPLGSEVARSVLGRSPPAGSAVSVSEAFAFEQPTYDVRHEGMEGVTRTEPGAFHMGAWRTGGLVAGGGTVLDLVDRGRMVRGREHPGHDQEAGGRTEHDRGHGHA
jgi:hypothetical protein